MKRASRWGVVALGLVGVMGCAPASPPPAGRPGSTAASGAGTLPGGTTGLTTAPRLVAGGIAAALDPVRGVPRFVRATTRQAAPAGATAVTAARAHLARHAAAYRAAPAALAGLELAAIHDTGRGGVVVTFRQRVQGVELYRGAVKVLMRRDLDLVAIAGTLGAPPAAPLAFHRDAPAALAAALAAHLGVAVPAAAAVTVGSAPGGYQRLDLAAPLATPEGALRLLEPARVKPVAFAGPGGLEAAHFVELLARVDGRPRREALRYVIADRDGRVLERRDLTADAWKYRVWADADGRPHEGPQADYTPHPTGVPDGSDPAFIPPILVERDAFNQNPAGQPDPWLAPDATESLGNNVDAYADLEAPDGFSAGDVRAAVTAAETFDYTYDTALGPHANATQTQAAVTQLFYTINWLHDWYYDSGFDEAAGNAQQDNFGRGGLGGDRILAEAQDYSEMNNSNMSTPADGASPRMQILLWSGPEERSLEVTPPGATLATGSAQFGPGDFDLTGTLALVNDGTAPVTDACQTVGSNVAGKIALLDRGTCTFKQKVLNAQAAGAIGVVLANNQGGAPPTLYDSQTTGTVTIPSLSVTKADGESLKTALQSGAVTAHLTRTAGTDRDGALDQSVVTHEWGHYLHGRLADCNQLQCAAMGEGWGDFLALHAALREGDDLDGTYGLAIYAARAMGDTGYFGLRRAPYSVDFTKNPFTFRHITDGEPLPVTAPLDENGGSNAEVHNAGEIWAEMLFEGYVALLRQTEGPTATRTYAAVRRAMSDIVVAGLKITPADATYTEARDAILAAAAANDPADEETLATAFARRGAGSCAEAPPRDSYDFAGVVESYEVKPRVVIGEPVLDDSIAPCDDNGRLDAGERGRLTVEVGNASIVALGAATLTVTSPTPGITFPEGPTVDLGALAAHGATTATVAVAFDASASATRLVSLDLTVAAPGACQAAVARTAVFRANTAERPAASATDDVEAADTTWTPLGDGAGVVWARVDGTPGNRVWRGIDLARPSDSWIESPQVTVSGSEDLVLFFKHRHQFERADGDDGPIYYDGAVVEISSDGGATWEDVASYGDPGYGGVIDNTAGNPLADRDGYVDENAAWPDLEPVTINLGRAFAGETIQVRFRIGTDQAAGGAGWDLDDIGFRGILETPFAAVVVSPGPCGAPLDTDAGVATDGAPDGASADGPRPRSGADLATCGGCAASQRPRGATLLALVALLVGLPHRRRRRG